MYFLEKDNKQNIFQKCLNTINTYLNILSTQYENLIYFVLYGISPDSDEEQYNTDYVVEFDDDDEDYNYDNQEGRLNELYVKKTDEKEKKNIHKYV